jgi:hypothetical protein
VWTKNAATEDGHVTQAIGIIGVGEIARAIVDGLCADREAAPAVFLSPRGAAVSADLARRHPSVQVCTSNQLIVRRVRPIPGSQLALFTTFDYHVFVTDRDGDTRELEADHRRHAIVEQSIAELKSAGLAHLPSGRFPPTPPGSPSPSSRTTSPAPTAYSPATRWPGPPPTTIRPDLPPTVRLAQCQTFYSRTTLPYSILTSMRGDGRVLQQRSTW